MLPVFIQGRFISNTTEQSQNYEVGSHCDGSLTQHVARLISVWDTDLDGGPGEAAQLFDVLSFLSNDGPYSLRWDVHMDCLLLWSLNTHMRHKFKNQQQAQQPLSPPELISEETTHVSEAFHFHTLSTRNIFKSEKTRESRYSHPKATIGGSSSCISRWRWRHVGGRWEETQSTEVESRHQMALLLWKGRRNVRNHPKMCV